ncbi:MAG: hypothetical protein ACK539_15490 [Planctomycetota bacterium]
MSVRILVVCALLLLFGACKSATLIEQVPTWKRTKPAEPQVAVQVNTMLAEDLPQDASQLLQQGSAVEYLRTLRADRQAHLDLLRASHSNVTKGAQEVLASLKEQALGYSTVRLWTGGTGVTAGIAAAVLVVASPANAATVAGLTSLGSGVVGFQASLAAEGMTREAVAKVHETVRKQVSKADNQFRNAFAKLLPKASLDDWETAAHEAETALLMMASAVTFVQMPESEREQSNQTKPGTINEPK